MAAGRNRSIVHPKQDAELLESSYRAWQTRRPQLFHQTSTSVPMASNTKQCIFVIADGQEEPVKLANTIHDSVASKSLISNTKAIASCGMIRRNAQKTIIDHTGRTYTSSSTISLRWYYDDGNQTFPETFYIVDSTANQLSYDAILRKTAESPLEAVVPQAHPVYPAPQGTDDDRKKARSDRAVTNQTVYERQVQEQRDRIRDAAVARQARTKHG